MARVYTQAYTAQTIDESDSIMTNSSVISNSINSLFGSDIISIEDLSLEKIKFILEKAGELKRQQINSQQPLTFLKNKIIANCFFEPSTRTRLSFETAVYRLGGNVIGFSSDDALSIRKGETLYDTVRVISEYADLMVIRHPKEGAARLAAEVSSKPVINAGDGANQHPTQALIDLFSIQESQQRLDGLAIALVGDLKYGRTIHSFAQACMLFDVRLFLVSPDALALPESICDTLKKMGVRFSFHQTIEEVIPKIDILYMSRIQQERFSTAPYQTTTSSYGASRNQNAYVLTPEMLATAKSHLKILHPLPRVNEIDVRVDKTPHAYYFEQAANGVFVRQALLTLLLNEI